MTHSLESPRRGRKIPHSRSIRGLLALLLATLLTACGGQPASLEASRYKVGPGDTITLSGASSDEMAGLKVQLQSSVNGSAFEDTGQATTTDRSGAYTFSYKPRSRGKTTLRVVINGAKSVTTREIAITLLDATQIESHLRGSSEVGLGERDIIVGTVSPAERGRVVSLETSTDGTTWIAVPAAVTTDADGSFTLRAPTTGAGAMRVRPTVSETPTHTAANGTPIKLFVSDYRAAGNQYLNCIYASNRAGEASNAAISEYDAGVISWSDLKKATKVYAQSVAEQITCLKNYSWPPSVAGPVRDLARQDAVIYDATMEASSAETAASYYAAFGADFRRADDAGQSAAAKIRRKLGLPASAG